MTKDRMIGIDNEGAPEYKSVRAVSEKDKKIIGLFVSELVTTVSNFSIDEAQNDLVGMFERARRVAIEHDKPNAHLSNETDKFDEIPDSEDQLREMLSRD